MKKDRLFLLDETVVPASLTQLREVTSTITTQIVILVSFLACFVATFSRLDAPFLLAIKRLCVRLEPHSHRSLNMFKSCLIKHGLDFLSFIKAAN